MACPVVAVETSGVGDVVDAAQYRANVEPDSEVFADRETGGVLAEDVALVNVRALDLVDFDVVVTGSPESVDGIGVVPAVHVGNMTETPQAGSVLVQRRRHGRLRHGAPRRDHPRRARRLRRRGRTCGAGGVRGGLQVVAV